MIVQGALVLVVDADPGIRALLTDGLVFRGFRVTAVESVREAIDAIDAERPSLALVDLRVLLDGAGALSERLARAPSRVPLIIMSEDPKAASRATEIGAI